LRLSRPAFPTDKDGLVSQSVNDTSEQSESKVCPVRVAGSLGLAYIGKMPPAAAEFHPHPLLKNGHVMTVASAFWRRRFELPAPADRLFQVDPESKILAHCHWQPGKDQAVPLLVMVHGLEGSSDSNYMCGIAEKAWQRGFHAIRLNQRNCGGTELLTPTLYNSGMSADYRAVLDELAGADGFTKDILRGLFHGRQLGHKNGR
jgi:predicted alpha/beta-fold hydrolase